MASPIRTTILISGSGTNLQAVIDKVQAGALNAQLIRVLSNRKDAYGLERARKASIPTEYHNLVKYKKAHPATPEGVQAAREEYDAELARLILADQPELVVCLGFMHILSPQFLLPLEKANVRIINLHPALPGAFNGVVSMNIYFSVLLYLLQGFAAILWTVDSVTDILSLQNAIERAHAAWMEGKIDKTGVMIHDVISEVDMGQPILVREIPFVKGQDEDLEVFEKRVHEIEWGTVVEGVGMVLEELQAARKQ